MKETSLNRRQVVQTLALSGVGLMLENVALAQEKPLEAVKVAALSSLKKDYSSADFKFDGAAALLVRLPNLPADQKRALEVKVSGKTFYLAAFTRVCTHLGCRPPLPDAGDHKMICPCHGSTYTADGTVVKGPAKRSLDSLTLELRGKDVYAVARVES